MPRTKGIGAYHFSGIKGSGFVKLNYRIFEKAVIQINQTELMAKSKRNIGLLKEELQKNPHDPYLLFQLGQSYYMIEDFKEAHY